MKNKINKVNVETLNKDQRLRFENGIAKLSYQTTYIIYDGEYYKIGRTSNIKKRLYEHKHKNKDTFENWKLISTSNLVSEYEAHLALREYRIKGEWFKFDSKLLIDVLSWFATGTIPNYQSPEDKLLNEIKNIK